MNFHSRCYGIYTYGKKDEASWEDKARKHFWPTLVKNKYVSHGMKYEPVAREAYEKGERCVVHECGLIVSRDEPWLGYSLDGIVIENGQPTRLLEIKCPYDLQDTEAHTLLTDCKRYLCKDKNGTLNLKKKHQYYGQVQLGMALLNLETCDFVIYSNVIDEIKIIKVNFDKNFVCAMLPQLKRRYFEKMLHVACKNSII